jgi:hypothetical protein
MDWKLKYLKYKAKYIDLKNKLENINLSGGDDTNNNNTNANTNANTNVNTNTIINSLSSSSSPSPSPNNNADYFNRLKELYPNCVKKSTESNDSTQTYGEMEYDGVLSLNKQINPSNTIKYFLDIGSGRGKLPCWFGGIDGIIKSIGIEIVEQRCLDANELKSNLGKDFPVQIKKVQLVCGSVENYNLGELIESNPNTLVWISNLCFGPELTEKVFTQILNQMPQGTIICCSRKPSDSIDSNTTNKLVYKSQIQIQMSWWDKLSDVFVYNIN